MGTKNNPGSFDCYANAEPDEPMFVLLGRDSSAWVVVQLWIGIKRKMRESGHSKISDEKLEEAEKCAEALKAWAASKGKDPSHASDAWNKLFLGFAEKVLTRMIEDEEPIR